MILTSRSTIAKIAFVGMTLSVLAGCQEEGGQPGGLAISESLLVTPEFRVEGLDDIRGEFLLQDLYLGIGEIRLEPLDKGKDGLAYVTRSSFPLHIDFNEGEAVIGEKIALPHPGEYLISITIEPVERDDSPIGSNSMRLDGLMAKFEKTTGTEGTKAAGEPVPLPWKVLNEGGEDSNAGPIHWVPWTYASAKDSFVTLNDVHFSSTKSQTLVISFDLKDWLNEAFLPINDAVDHHFLMGVEERSNETEFEPIAVDVTDAIDGLGEGGGDLTSKSEAYVR
jgi:hypothetical protein